MSSTKPTFDDVLRIVFGERETETLDAHGLEPIRLANQAADDADLEDLEGDDLEGDDTEVISTAVVEDMAVLLPDADYGSEPSEWVEGLGDLLRRISDRFEEGPMEGYARQTPQGIAIDLDLPPEDTELPGYAMALLTPVREGLALVVLGVRVDFAAIARGEASQSPDPRALELLEVDTLPTEGSDHQWYLD